MAKPSAPLATRVAPFALAVALPLALLSGACSSGASTTLPPGDGNVAGGPPVTQGAPSPSSPAPAPTSTSTPPPPPGSSGGTPTGGVDAGATSDAGAAMDSGPGYFIDTGAGGGTTPSGPLGSCTNPACGSTGTECGCTATDSSGNQVQLGCEVGGQCACFVNGNLDTNPVDENGACGTPLASAQLFLTTCTCQ